MFERIIGDTEKTFYFIGIFIETRGDVYVLSTEPKHGIAMTTVTTS